jgi:hypothetical protein
MFSIAAVASAAVFGAKAGAPMMKLNNGVMMPQVALGKLWCRNEVVWTDPLGVLISSCFVFGKAQSSHAHAVDGRADPGYVNRRFFSDQQLTT